MKARDFLLNYAALFFLLVLTADALVANWTLDPLFDILYTRIQMNLFYNAHPISVLAVCAAAFWMVWKKDGLPVAVFAAFGTASTHEIALDISDLGVYHISSGLSWTYLLYLLAFLGLGLVLGKQYHRRVLGVTFIIMLAWFFILTALPHYSTIDPEVPFGASPYFYSPLANVEEVVSWLVPASLWFMPRRMFQWSSPRLGVKAWLLRGYP